MRERLLLITSAFLLVGSADHALFVGQSIAQESAPASILTTWQANLASVGEHVVIAEAEPVAPVADTANEALIDHKHTHTVAPITRLQLRQLAQAKQQHIEEIKEIAAARQAAKPKIHPAIDQDDIKERHQQIANEAIQLMPSECYNVLRNFYVRYDNPSQRGLGGKTTIILSGNVPDDEFRALFIHEFGHLLDLGCLQGNPKSGATNFKDGNEIMYADDPSVAFYRISWVTSNVQRQGASEADFVSGYASWDMFEDFAESFAYYMLHRSDFAARAQDNAALAAKYTWFQTYLPQLPAVAIGAYDADGDVPWDTTKLPYSWQGSSVLANRR